MAENDSVDAVGDDYIAASISSEEAKKRLLALGESEDSADQLLADWNGEIEEQEALDEEEEEEEDGQ